MNKKLRRLRVYEKGGSSILKFFLFISHHVDLALHLMSQQHCSRVCFIINALSRQTKIVVATQCKNFFRDRAIKLCRDIEKYVVTFPLVLF